MTEVTNIVRRAVTTVADLFEGLDADEKEEMLERLAARGYKAELTTTKRLTGTTGGPILAANAYREFNHLDITVGGRALLKFLRRPCCALPDRTDINPNTGQKVERAITFGRWSNEFDVTVGYSFGSGLPDAGDTLSAEDIAECFEVALACWQSVSGIRLVRDDYGSANVYCQATRMDGMHGVLADMMLPGPGIVGPSVRCRGRFDVGESWHVRRPGKPLGASQIDFLNVLIHELGHAWGLDHEPGMNQEIMNPGYWPAAHLLEGGRHWVGPKDTKTMRGAYGPPTATPPPPPPPDPGDPGDPGDPTPHPAAPRHYRLAGAFAGRVRPGDDDGFLHRLDGTYYGPLVPE